MNYIFQNEAYRFIVEGQLEVFQELKYKLFFRKRAGKYYITGYIRLYVSSFW